MDNFHIHNSIINNIINLNTDKDTALSLAYLNKDCYHSSSFKLQHFKDQYLVDTMLLIQRAYINLENSYLIHFSNIINDQLFAVRRDFLLLFASITRFRSFWFLTDFKSKISSFLKDRPLFRNIDFILHNDQSLISIIQIFQNHLFASPSEVLFLKKLIRPLFSSREVVNLLI